MTDYFAESAPPVVFKVGARVVGFTRATRQSVISRRMDALARRYPGQTIEAHYPTRDTRTD